MKKAVICISLGLVSFVCSTTCVKAQTGQFLDEYGGGFKAIAMGQAFTAIADDYSAAYYNPAGLTQIKSIFESVNGYIYAKPRTKAYFPQNPEYDIVEDEAVRGMFSGVASNLDIGTLIEAYPWLEPLAFGLVSFMNLPEIIQYHTPPSYRTPYFFRYNDRFQLLNLAISMGYEVTPWLSLGMGFLPAVTSRSVQKSFEALNMIDDPVQGQRLSIYQVAEMFVTPIAGIMIRPPGEPLREKLSFGLCYRGEIKSFHGKGPLLEQAFGIETEDGEVEKLFVIPQVQIINVVSFNPRQISAGVAYRSPRGLTFSAEFTWKDYSKYRYFMDEPPDPPFRDTVNPRLGIGYTYLPPETDGIISRLSSVSLCAGYYRENSPVQDMNGSFNILDSDQNVYSAGGAFSFDAAGMEHIFEAFFQVHDIVPRYISNETDTLFGPIRVSGAVYATGVSYTTCF